MKRIDHYAWDTDCGGEYVGRRLRAALLFLLIALPLSAATPVSETEGNSGIKTFTVSFTQGPQNLPGTYSWETVDGTATAADNDYVPASGVVVIPAGGGTGFIEVNLVGDTKLEDDEVFYIDVKNFANGPFEITIQNDDVATLTVGNTSVVEGNSGTTLLNFPVSLTTQSAIPVNAVYETTGGTATAGQDYIATEGNITFAPGETTKTVSVTVNGDTLVEPDEVVNLRVTPTGSNIGSNGTGTIINDDLLALTVSSPSVTEGNSGTTAMTFDVTLAQPSASPTVATYITEGISATSGTDFQPAQGTITFNPNETRKTVAVTIIGDTAFEPDETLALAVTLPGTPAVRGTGTIRNDDAAPPSTLTIVSGNNQSGLLGKQLPQPLVVEVRDARGGPAAGTTVTWRVVRGSAQLSSTTSTTDAQGRASTTVTLTSVGTIEIEASVAGLTPVKFTLGSSTQLEARAEGPVAKPVGRALDEICARNEEQFNAVCRALTALGDVTPTLEHIAPQPSGAQAKIATEFVSAVTSDIRHRLSMLRGGADRVSIQQLSLFHHGRAIPVAQIASLFVPQTLLSAPSEQTGVSALQEDDYNGWSAFLSGNLGDGERKNQNGALGFELETQGVSFGVDRLIGRSSIVGASVNWMNLDSTLDANAGTVDTTGYSLSVYASRSFERLYLDGALTFGQNTYDTEHVVDIPGMPLSRATSENDATIFAVTAATGIDAHKGRGDFDLSLSGTWSRSDIDDLAEAGPGPLILFVQGHDIESLVATLGFSTRAAFAVPFGTLLPSFRAELVHEFESDARLVTARFLRDTLGTSFTVPVDQPDENYGKLAAGLQAEFGYGISAFLEVTQDVARSDLKFRTFQFNLRKAF